MYESYIGMYDSYAVFYESYIIFEINKNINNCKKTVVLRFNTAIRLSWF